MTVILHKAKAERRSCRPVKPCERLTYFRQHKPPPNISILAILAALQPQALNRGQGVHILVTPVLGVISDGNEQCVLDWKGWEIYTGQCVHPCWMQDSGRREADLHYKKEPCSQEEEASLQGSVLCEPLATQGPCDTQFHLENKPLLFPPALLTALPLSRQYSAPEEQLVTSSVLSAVGHSAETMLQSSHLFQWVKERQIGSITHRKEYACFPPPNLSLAIQFTNEIFFKLVRKVTGKKSTPPTSPNTKKEKCGKCPHTFRCSFTTSCTATSGSGCAYLSTEILMATDALRCTCSSVDLSMATHILGCPAPLWAHPQVTEPSARLHTGFPASPAQQHRHSSDALAICRPRHITTAIIRMVTPSCSQPAHSRQQLEKDYPAYSTTSQERNRENVFLEPTAVNGWAEKGREQMPLPYRNTERTDIKAEVMELPERNARNRQFSKDTDDYYDLCSEEAAEVSAGSPSPETADMQRMLQGPDTWEHSYTSSSARPYQRGGAAAPPGHTQNLLEELGFGENKLSASNVKSPQVSQCCVKHVGGLSEPCLTQVGPPETGAVRDVKDVMWVPCPNTTYKLSSHPVPLGNSVWCTSTRGV
ncbi:hypothetical protein EK904_011911 [Melospiza melodia maxima]|nr:hypothetical protein EK904_011911 [Melospiza melodia maxima]